MTAQEYLAAHEITVEFAQSRGITWDSEFVNVPIVDGKTCWYKSRNLLFDPDDSSTGDKYKNETGTRATVFNIDRHKDTAAVVLAEGEMDALKLEQEGISAVSGTAGAETFDKRMAKLLLGKSVYVCYDNDAGGKKGVAKVLSLIPDAKIIQLPVGYKDVCDFFHAGHTRKDFTAIAPQTYEDWLIANEPKQFAFIEGSELLKRELPEEEWFVERVVPTEGFVFIVGAEATGKSFLTLTLADSITTGKKWLGKFEVKKNTNVLFLDKENTQKRTQNRMKGLGVAGNNMYWLEYPAYFGLADPDEEDGFSAFIKSTARKAKRYGIGLIVVDSFTDLMVGNESLAGDTQKFFDCFRQLFPNITVIVLHHENKPAPGAPKNSSQRTRGSTNLMAQIVVGFRVEALPKVYGEFKIEQTKAGDAEKLPKFVVRMSVAHDPADTSKTIVTSLDYMGEIEDNLKAVDDSTDFIQSYVEGAEGAITRKQLFDAGVGEGLSESSLKRAFDMLKEKNIIYTKQNPEKRNEVLVFAKLWGARRGEELDLD